MSLISVPYKVLQKVNVQFCSEKHYRYYIISLQQLGFQSGNSTLTKLILTYKDNTATIDQLKTVDLVFFD